MAKRYDTRKNLSTSATIATWTTRTSARALLFALTAKTVCANVADRCFHGVWLTTIRFATTLRCSTLTGFLGAKSTISGVLYAPLGRTTRLASH
jgi:hypothetical protein